MVVDLPFGRTDDLFDGCEVVVRRIVNQRVAALPLEPRSVGGGLGRRPAGAVVGSTQHAHGVRDALASAYGLAPAEVRVIAPDVGGGFGAKIGAPPRSCCSAGSPAGAAAPCAGPRPAARTSSPWDTAGARSRRRHRRSPRRHRRGLPPRRAAGGRRLPRHGRLPAVPHPDDGAGHLRHPSGPADIRRSSPTPRPRSPTGARAGPEATAAIERAMDLFAAEIGLDPAEVRREPDRTGRLPVHDVDRRVYDVGDYPRARPRPRRRRLRRRCAPSRPAGATAATLCQLGIGTRSTSRSPPVPRPATSSPGSRSPPTARRPCTRAPRRTARAPHRVRHARRRGARHPDRPHPGGPRRHRPRPPGQGHDGPRSLQLGGAAVRGRLEPWSTRRQVAADLLEANPDDLVLDPVDGRFHVAGTPGLGRSWAELAVAATEGRRSARRAITDFQADQPTYPFGAHVAVVEVDTETGDAALLRLVAVDDAGRILNPLLADGQRHGGIAQGAAQALSRRRVRQRRQPDHVEPRRLRQRSRPPSCPSFELVRLETPTWVNPLGAKGIGEAARSAPPRPCSPRWSTRSPTSASATSTCPAPPSGSGGHPGSTDGTRTPIGAALAREQTPGSGLMEITVTVNGRAVESEVEPRPLLVHLAARRARPHRHEHRVRHLVVRCRAPSWSTGSR